LGEGDAAKNKKRKEKQNGADKRRVKKKTAKGKAAGAKSFHLTSCPRGQKTRLGRVSFGVSKQGYAEGVIFSIPKKVVQSGIQSCR
jgi:hypothetical protein